MRKLERLSKAADIHKVQIILLQETHILREDNDTLKSSLPNFTWFFCEGTGRSRGVAIGILKSMLRDHDNTICERDNEGRWINVNVKLSNGKFSITSLYLPEKLQIDTLNILSSSVISREDSHMIVGGDFNIDPVRDTNMSDFFFNWFDVNNLLLLDNPFPTWGGTSRIDHMSIDSNLSFSGCDLEVIPGNANDHSILLTKCSNDRADAIRFPLKRIDDRYASSSILHRDTIERLGHYRDEMDPAEYLINFIKTAHSSIVSNSKFIVNNEDAQDMNALLAALDTSDYIDLPENLKVHKLIAPIVKKLKLLKVGKRKKRKRWKSELRQMIAKFRKEKGIDIRHLLPNEQPKLPKFRNKNFFRLITNTAKVIEDPLERDRMIGDYWAKLFNSKRLFDTAELQKLIDMHPKLPENVPSDYKVDIKRLRKIFSKAYKSSQGPDGTPFSLLTSSFPLLEEVWIKLIENMAKGGFVWPKEFTNGLLFLLPKGEGDIEVRDFRPISVTNAIYRLTMKYWAKEMATTIEPIISPNQKALLKNRSIYQAVRDIADEFYNRIANMKDTIFVQTDFAKAFDFVNRDTLRKAMEGLNVPLHLRNVAEIALLDSDVTIANSSPKAKSFKSVTGVRQGCPLSPLLYLIIVDLLVFQLMKIPEVVVGASYADDNGLIINSCKGLDKILKAIRRYEKATGAELNMAKSSIIYFLRKGLHLPYEWREIQIKEKSTYLGLPIMLHPSVEELWRDTLAKINITAGFIRNSKLTPSQRIPLINTYIISQLQYKAHFNLIQNKEVNAIWNAIRRCLGIKCSMSQQALSQRYCVLELKPSVIDPLVRNIAILASSPIKGNEYKMTSPFSSSYQRVLALTNMNQIITNNSTKSNLFSTLSDKAKFAAYYKKVQPKNCVNNLYNIMMKAGPKVTPFNLLNDLSINNILASYYLQRNLRHATNNQWRNAYIFYLNKAAPLNSKINYVCPSHPASCNYCGAVRQTHKHILSECSVASWIYSNPLNSQIWPKNQSDLLCVEKNLSKEEVNLRLKIFHILYTYNFKHSNLSEFTSYATNECRNTIKDLEERKRRAAPKSKDSEKRNPPECTTTFSLFCDGSVNPNLLNGGFGYSIQRNRVEVKAYCCSLSNHTINEAEGTGLINGLYDAHNMGIKRITAFSDSKIVIGLCNDEGVCTSPNLYHIYVHIQKLKEMFEEIHFKHTYRDFNTRADVLAFTACNNPSMCDQIIKDFNAPRPANVVTEPFPHLATMSKKQMTKNQTAMSLTRVPTSKFFGLGV
jgi:ribonuclease HI